MNEYSKVLEASEDENTIEWPPVHKLSLSQTDELSRATPWAHGERGGPPNECRWLVNTKASEENSAEHTSSHLSMFTYSDFEIKLKGSILAEQKLVTHHNVQSSGLPWIGPWRH